MNEIRKALRAASSPKKAKVSQWFFKTGKGDYGEHDRFLGVTVPEQRRIAKRFRALPLRDALSLLKSAYHEERLTAIFLLVDQFQRGDEKTQKTIFRSYLANTKWINNWDIVDSSAPHIVGTYLLKRPRTVLTKLLRSKNIWERRIAVLATQAFIRHGEVKPTFLFARQLLGDRHDLIHKAVGWMLREAGQKDREALLRFLKQHKNTMPRTMLRYAIEKLPTRTRYAILRT